MAAQKKQNGAILTLKNDVIFRAVYGKDDEESKYVLMALLNHILNREEDPIVSLEYKNPFHPRERVLEKESILDIKVKTGSGEMIDIEMQICNQEYLKNRLLYYHGGLIRSSLNRGESYDKMLKTITICIIDDTMFPETKNFLNFFSFLEETTHIPFTNMTGICVIELPKVNPERKPIEKLTKLELCLEYLRHADEEGSEYQDALIRLGGKELEMTQSILRKTAGNDMLRERALAREKYLHDKATDDKRKAELKELEEYVERIQAELAHGQKELAHGQKELAHGQEELAHDQAELANNQAELARSQERFKCEQDKFECDKNKLKRERDEFEQVKCDLKEQLQASDQQMEVSKEQVEISQKQLEESQRQLEESQRQLKESKRDMAKMLKADHMPIEKIIDYTGLSELEIENL